MTRDRLLAAWACEVPATARPKQPPERRSWRVRAVESGGSFVAYGQSTRRVIGAAAHTSAFSNALERASCRSLPAPREGPDSRISPRRPSFSGIARLVTIPPAEWSPLAEELGLRCHRDWLLRPSCAESALDRPCLPPPQRAKLSLCSSPRRFASWSPIASRQASRLPPGAVAERRGVAERPNLPAAPRDPELVVRLAIATGTATPRSATEAVPLDVLKIDQRS